jgi:hypothetical protein
MECIIRGGHVCRFRIGEPASRAAENRNSEPGATPEG